MNSVLSVWLQEHEGDVRQKNDCHRYRGKNRLRHRVDCFPRPLIGWAFLYVDFRLFAYRFCGRQAYALRGPETDVDAGFCQVSGSHMLRAALVHGSPPSCEWDCTQKSGKSQEKTLMYLIFSRE